MFRTRCFCLAPILLVCVLITTSSWGRPDFFTNRCAACHSNDNPSCIGCHHHGAPSSASTDKTVYRPGETVTVTMAGSSRGTWARALLYSQTDQELDRITGPTNSGDDGTEVATDQYPFTLTGPAPAQAGNYTWQAAWWGARNDRDMSDTREVRVTTNQFSVVVPTGSITIDGGAAFTSSTTVALTLSAQVSGGSIAQMRFSNDEVTWSGWEAYATAKTWTLTSGDGLKTVYVQYEDNTGYVTPSFSDTITLDATPPTGSITINGGDASTTSTSVTLDLAATDAGSGVAMMRFSNDGVNWGSWEAYATTHPWTLPENNGEKTVYAQFLDGAGNVSSSASDSIVLEGQSPARHWWLYH